MKAKFVAALSIATAALLAQSFEVATIKPTEPDWKGGRYMTMKGAQFAAKNFTLRYLIASAYDLSLGAVSGGPSWIDDDHYDILAKTPGDVKPSPEEQMSMLRQLIGDRFQLSFHREPKQFSIYVLSISKGGPKLREPTPSPNGPQPLIFSIAPNAVKLPAREATVAELASVMQRAVLDRPIVDKAGLSGRYDFDLEWTPEETQFNNLGLHGTAESTKPDLFAAIQQQLGLRLEATRGPIEAMVIDKIERPSPN